MAFCTSCGAQVKGAFCEQCGTPASASAASSAPSAGAQPAMNPPPMTPPPAYQGAPPPMSPPPPYQAPPAAGAPVARKTSPIVWILVAVFGIFLLGAVAVAGFTFFVFHKAREAGLDPELMRRNPGLAVSRMIAAANPDIQVLNTDDRAGTITIRDKKDGQVMTLSFDDVKNGRFKLSAVGKNGEVANVEIGGGAGKLPSWVPEYPGARATGNFTAQGDDGSGRGSGGVVAFESSDPPNKVMDFYKDKINSMGMKTINVFTQNDTGMLTAQDDDGKRTLNVTVGRSGNATSIGLTFGEKR